METTLKLFNCVLSKNNSTAKPFISHKGLIIMPNALWRKKEIEAFFESAYLSDRQLNKTFHKSWSVVADTTEAELIEQQIMHYLSTYGTNFCGEVYIPDQEVNLDFGDDRTKFIVVNGLSKEEISDKCLEMLNSGIALKEDTLTDILSVLFDECQYELTNTDNIRNKEAVTLIAKMYNIFPQDPVSFFRVIVSMSCDNSLLIKNNELIMAIKGSKFNPTIMFREFGLERLAEIFNRFKPLFLAYKRACPKTINKIAKLSKKYHKPMVENPLNKCTSQILTDKELHWLDNATPFALFKALNALSMRGEESLDFTYRVRNGKSYVATNDHINVEVCKNNLEFIVNYLKGKNFSFTNKKVFIPQDVSYALPTSEKNFVGNIPTNTIFYGNELAAGIYWEDKWGARDLDLSGISIDGKVGWNSSLRDNNRTLMHSGDMTSAPDGAVEYLYVKNGIKNNTLVINSIFSGDVGCKFRIIIGKGSDINKSYMMDPNNLFYQCDTVMTQRQATLGYLFRPEEKEDEVGFALLNYGGGNSHISKMDEQGKLSLSALKNQLFKQITCKELLEKLGVVVVSDKSECDIDLSIENLTKDTFVELFKYSK